MIGKPMLVLIPSFGKIRYGMGTSFFKERWNSKNTGSHLLIDGVGRYGIQMAIPTPGQLLPSRIICSGYIALAIGLLKVINGILVQQIPHERTTGGIIYA